MDEDEPDNLGPVGAWQIKDFPVALRQRIIAAAKQNDQTVPEFVTAVMVRHFDRDPEAEPEKRFENRVNRSENRFRSAIEMACALTAHQGQMPKGIARLATRLVKAEMEALLPTKPQFPPAARRLARPVDEGDG